MQVKTWNLSSIVRIPTAAGDVWCKSVPPFFAHEGKIIAMVAADDPALVAPLLAADHPTATVLLGDVPGDDQWDAPVERLVDMVRRLVRLQSRWAGRTEELLAAGLWDFRAAGFAALVDDLLRRAETRERLHAAELDAVDALAARVPDLLEELLTCGLPETLVHGDFHPGNWRYGPDGLVLLDWGDSAVGHPMLDFTAFLPRVPDGARPVVLAAWLDAWRGERPEADPERAAELIAPLAALRQALIYRAFLDAIEPGEHTYHEDDPAVWLRAAIEAEVPATSG